MICPFKDLRSFIWLSVCLIVLNVLFTKGYRFTDGHDREFTDQHRCFLHYCVLLQLETESSGHLLPSSHRLVWSFSG